MIRLARFSILITMPLSMGIILWFVGNFDVTYPPAWDWLVGYIKTHKTIPPYFLWAAYGGVGVALALLLVIQIIASRVKARTVSGERGQKDLHGSARWAVWKDVKRAGLIPIGFSLWVRFLIALRFRPAPTGERGVVVGGYLHQGKLVVLRHDGPEHILCYAPTRSGKGVGLVLPTLLSWPESTLVLDIKGENYAKTAGWRHSIGQRIIKFEPAALAGSARFNPLAEVRIGTDYEIADVQNIAMMIIDPKGKGLQDFWAKSGFAWLTCCILYALYHFKEEGRTASLGDVGTILSVPGESLPKLLNTMIDFEAGDRKEVTALIRSEGQTMKDRADQERSGVHSTVLAELNLYKDKIVASNIDESDFTVDDLMNGDRPTSLYLILPPSDIDRLRPLFRVVINLILRRLTKDMKFDGGKAYKHRLLLMLDEFTSLGKLEIFQQSIAYMAGYGLKAFIIVQDLTQLQSTETGYGKDESISSNCHIKIAYAPNRIETAEVLSKMAGKTTVVQVKRSVSGKATDLVGSVSESLNEVSRPLLTADECMALKGIEKQTTLELNPATGQWEPKETCKDAGDMLIFPAGFYPIYGRQPLYFQDPDLLARSKMSPPTPTTQQEDNTP